jgi:hypothetical protein
MFRSDFSVRSFGGEYFDFEFMMIVRDIQYRSFGHMQRFLRGQCFQSLVVTELRTEMMRRTFFNVEVVRTHLT